MNSASLFGRLSPEVQEHIISFIAPLTLNVLRYAVGRSHILRRTAVRSHWRPLVPEAFAELHRQNAQTSLLFSHMTLGYNGGSAHAVRVCAIFEALDPETYGAVRSLDIDIYCYESETKDLCRYVNYATAILHRCRRVRSICLRVRYDSNLTLPTVTARFMRAIVESRPDGPFELHIVPIYDGGQPRTLRLDRMHSFLDSVLALIPSTAVEELVVQAKELPVTRPLLSRLGPPLMAPATLRIGTDYGPSKHSTSQLWQAFFDCYIDPKNLRALSLSRMWTSQPGLPGPGCESSRFLLRSGTTDSFT